MKEKTFKNLSLKILSAVFAVVLWTVIVNIYDPTTSYTFSNVTVQLINTESLTEKNYSYEVVDGEKISVYVSGPKSVVTDIKASDIVATADLSEISAFADYVDIHVSVIKDGEVQDVEATPKTSAIRLNIENRETTTVDISSNVLGSPADGYAVIDESFNPSSVKLTGASSVVNSIERAEITYDVTGATANVTGAADIVFYDAEGNVVDGSSIEITQTSIDYIAYVGQTKTVDIEVATSGTPKSGYAISGIELNQTQAVVYGDADKLNNLDKIVIPADNLNVDELSADKTFKYTLANYIDSSLSILGNQRLEVTIRVQATTSKTLTLNTANISVTGLEEGVNYAFESTTYTVEVEGTDEALALLDTAGVTASINLSTYTSAQTKDIGVSVTLPAGVKLKGTATVSVVFSSGEDEATSSGDDVTQTSTDNSTTAGDGTTTYNSNSTIN